MELWFWNGNILFRKCQKKPYLSILEIGFESDGWLYLPYVLSIFVSIYLAFI